MPSSSEKDMKGIKAKILSLVREYSDAGQTPSLTEIMLDLGISSVEVINACLAQLESDGLIEQTRFGIKPIRSVLPVGQMPKTNRKLRVFLCHASHDKPIVRELYQRLLAEGWIDPWLDEEKLLPGQEWDMEIVKAVENSDVVIVCLSNNSITKEGYVQRELRVILDISEEKPEGTIFMIPLRLDDCAIPRRFRGYQYQDYFPVEKLESGYARLLMSLDFRAKNLKLKVPNKIDDVNFVARKDAVNMASGLSLHQTNGGVYFGTYEILRFTEKENGKILKILAKSQGEKFWIELWGGVYDGVDKIAWVNNRVRIIRSLYSSNPETNWRIEAGNYTVYFVAYNGDGKIVDYDISYNILVEI